MAYEYIYERWILNIIYLCTAQLLGLFFCYSFLHWKLYACQRLEACMLRCSAIYHFSKGGGVPLATPSVQSHPFAFTAVRATLLWSIGSTGGQFLLYYHWSFVKLCGVHELVSVDPATIWVAHTVNWLRPIFPFLSFLFSSHFRHCIYDSQLFLFSFQRILVRLRLTYMQLRTELWLMPCSTNLVLKLNIVFQRGVHV